MINTQTSSENTPIEVRGFLFRDQNGQVILTDTPHIRSCCVGKEDVAQLFLSGEFPETLPTQIAVVRGMLNMDGTKSLEEASIVNTSSSLGLMFFLSLPLLLLLLILASRFLKRRD